MNEVPDIFNQFIVVHGFMSLMFVLHSFLLGVTNSIVLSLSMWLYLYVWKESNHLFCYVFSLSRLHGVSTACEPLANII